MTLTDSDLQRAKELCEVGGHRLGCSYVTMLRPCSCSGPDQAISWLEKAIAEVERLRAETAELRTRLSMALKDQPHAGDPDWSKR
jgi:hypothetical protein